MSIPPNDDTRLEAVDSGVQVLAHYELLGKLGEGGMGIVHRARDTRLGRCVALKVLPPDRLNDAVRRQRFLREAMLASALNHPNIVTIHDIQSDQGRDFIVMELVEGRSLHDLISPGGLEITQALRYATQMADAMAAAHAAGIVHRDLKPHNVMVTHEGTGGADGQVKVLDFGVAKLSTMAGASPAGTTITALTGHGEAPGTLAYMSPEQLRGEEVDARADIFSLGVVCYEMLTGRRPFQGANAVDLAHEIYFAEPEPITHLRPELPAALDTVLTRALSKQRSNRQGSMDAFRSELAGLASEHTKKTEGSESEGAETEGAESEGAETEGAKTKGDDPEVVLVESSSESRGAHDQPPVDKVSGLRWILPAVILSLALLAWGLVPGVREVVAPWRTPPPASVEAPTAAAEASIHELYLRGLDQLDHYYQPGQIALAIESFQRMLAKDRNSAAAYAGLAQAYLFKHRNESRDHSWREKALATAQRAVELNGDLAAARASLGLVLVSLGEFDEAQPHLQQALVLDPFNLDAFRGLGQIQERLGQFEEAETIYRRALEMRPEDRRLHDLLGALCYRTGRYQEAEAAFLHSIELAPMSPFGHRNLAAVYHMQGKFTQAADQLQRVLALHPTASVYNNLGTLYFYQGLYQEALVAFEKALEFKGSASNFRRWANLADAYRWTPDNDQEAQDAYLRAIQLLREELAQNPSDTILQSYLALLLAKREDCEEALEELKRLEELDAAEAIVWFRTTVANEVCGRREAALRALVATLEAGYSLTEIQREPELLSLRYDVRYQKTVMEFEELRAKP